MEDELKRIICTTIDNRSSDLKLISKELWENPELGYEEYKAHELLTKFLEKEGFNVLKKTPLETSFIARYGNGEGLKIGICCEYDALPGIGHACGHNLIAEASIGTALGIKAALSSQNDHLNAEVILFGTPAEEGGGGKIKMIEKGVFDEIDFCMMSHPCAHEVPEPNCLAVAHTNIVFKGKPSHAAAAPWEGINALDAAVACYNSISMLRQQITPRSRIHAIIVDGGTKPNIIPERSELSVYIRDTGAEGTRKLRERVLNCAKGAAISTGCSFDTVKDVTPLYDSVAVNKTLINLYMKHASSLGVDFNSTLPQHKNRGSTDMGNVSRLKPAIHPFFKINSFNASNHTFKFTEASILDENQLPTLNSAKSMAMTAIEVVCNEEILAKVKEDFQKM